MTPGEREGSWPNHSRTLLAACWRDDWWCHLLRYRCPLL